VHAAWDGDDYRIRVGGTMRESRIYGSCLSLSREIVLGLNDRTISITDTVENLEPTPEEFMILYHINFGYPLVEAGGEVFRSAARTMAMTEMTAEQLGAWNHIEEPRDDCAEQVFYHVHENGQKTASAAVLNRKLGLGVSITYSADTLPVLVHWKSMRSHDYTVALEPSNSYILGRKAEREHGSLTTLPGYGLVQYRIELGILDGNAEMDAFITKE